MRINRQPVKVSAVRLAVLSALLALQPINTSAEPAGARYRVTQPSQPLSDALKSIAKQTNSSVLFDPGVVGQRLSQPVAGEFSGAEAISRALEGTGLTSEVMKDGSIVVKPRAALPPALVVATQVGGAYEPTATDGSNPARAAFPIQLAQVQSAAQGTSDAGASTPADLRQDEMKPQRVEVTGSRIKRVETDTALPINVYTRQDIEKSGQPTLAGFLATLNEFSVRNSEGGTGASRGLGTVQLRGLPLGTTLVLINGRRMQSIGSAVSQSLFDLNLVPAAAIERVEVLPVGSSAVYGGDALGGVVNIILKKSADGFAADASYGSANGTSDTNLSLVTGASSERGSFLLLAASNRTTPLFATERSFFVDADYRRFGGVDTRRQGCNPGTVSSTTGGNLPGLSSPIAGIPSGISGRPLTPADFVATAGLPNLCSERASGKGQTLADGRETSALHATGDYRIGRDLSIFGELTYTDMRSTGGEFGIRLNSVGVPASNAFNPFGEPVRVTARLGLENGKADGFDQISKYTRALLGMRGDLSAGWELEVAALVSKDDTPVNRPNTIVNSAALSTALAASDAAMALNPFTTGRAASEDVLRSIWSDEYASYRGEKEMVNAFARGTAFVLPAGPVDVVAGAEWSRDKLVQFVPNAIDIDTGRRSSALFAEARVPLLSRPDGASRLGLATLTLAGRRDSYSDFGAATTYQAGLELRPVRTALVRAAASTSFKPPSLTQLNTAPFSIPLAFIGLVDPARGNTPIVGGLWDIGPNPDLKPEKGRADVLGIVWEPEALSGLRMSVTAWQVAIEDLIVFAFPQSTLNNESSFPGLISRGPSVGGVPGPVTRVFSTNVNFGRVDIAGSDWELAHTLATQVGRWRLSGSATRTSKYDVAAQPGAPVEDRLGKRNFEAWAPKWKGRVAAQLERGAWSVGATGRYVGKYDDTPPSTRELGGTWIMDLSANVDLKKSVPSVGGTIKTATLSAAVVNVANKLPTYVGTAPFYDTTQSDWRGRYASVRLAVGW